MVGAIPQDRIKNASQELMALSKISSFKVIHGKSIQYRDRVLEAAFWTVFVTVEERDKLFEASRANASKKAK
ncbi:hypothetical protein Q8W38_11460 [Vibrio splendidus]|uniref:Uncharacterized protein n=1 Tax=Vibrio splendidus TaxID=29497 RepID=A0ABD5A9Y0_VIBSP|nr:hypothetical protein [Vibrio splendidus]MDP2489955.1 hypothetical protein [Vibrio splendidus]